MRTVIVESPFAGDVATNTLYARVCMFHSLGQGVAPYASHLLYPQVLDDAYPAARERGIRAGYAWADLADEIRFYLDLDWSSGMRAAAKRYEEIGRGWCCHRIRLGAHLVGGIASQIESDTDLIGMLVSRCH